MAGDSAIKSIDALECLDSRGFPTLMVTTTLNDGTTGTALVPSGASTGEYEAHELRDKDTGRFLGKGVLKAVTHIEDEIAPALTGTNCCDVAELDRKMIELDGTENKSRLGANAILGVSLASAHAAAAYSKKPLYKFLGSEQSVRLPVPLVNVINGGAHATNSIDFQEFMLVPHGFQSFSESLQAAAEVFHNLKKILVSRKLSTGLGDEGGFAPDLDSSDAAIQALLDAIGDAGYSAGDQISLALDVAASEFYNKEEGKYILHKSSNDKLTSDELVSVYSSWADKYPLVSIEDGLDENDWDGWKKLTDAVGDRVQLVGDDLFVTNRKRLQTGIDQGSGNSILIKLNQIGSLSETLDTIGLAHEHKYSCVISHRSGETEDTSIADLAVATNAGQIKTGSVCRSERTAKYNRLLWIERDLGDKAVFTSPFK